MTNYFSVDNILFDYYLKRFLLLQENGYLGIDGKLKDIIPEFHSFKNIIPIFSCSGHKHNPNGYICFVTKNKKGIDDLHKLFHLIKMCLSYEVILESDFHLDNHFLIDPLGEEWLHPAHSIRWRCNNTTYRDHILNAIKKNIKQF